MQWNYWVSGGIMALVAFAVVNEKPKFGWVIGSLGVWLIASAFIPIFSNGIGQLCNGMLAGTIFFHRWSFNHVCLRG
ncbi:MAG TPA: hypothetical protein VJ964_17745 [Balneolaceae bacterium]|nr:hypothetical protein [Balneolaceae bacterium]